jgi:tRNA-dihydrouridine synthase B
MTRGFWENLSLPIIGLAPMDGVTDAAFRYIMAKYGRPDVIITEFTAAEGIRASALRLLDDFYYDPLERPVVAQLFGADPNAFFIAAVVASAMGFDGLDVNMGCPAKNITGRGAGAALIEDPERAKEIVRQTRAGNQAWVDGIELTSLPLSEEIITAIQGRQRALSVENIPRQLIPVSVKTRIGITENVIESWAQHLLEVEPVAITIHGRTLKQLYTGLANWDAIAAAATIIHQTPTLVLGNGDVKSKADAVERASTYDLDGVLIGRASFGNPWLFSESESTLEERLRVALEHARYLDKALEGRGFIRIRKHLLDYTRDFPGAKDLRKELMQVRTLEDIESILEPIVSPPSI